MLFQMKVTCQAYRLAVCTAHLQPYHKQVSLLGFELGPIPQNSCVKMINTRLKMEELSFVTHFHKIC